MSEAFEARVGSTLRDKWTLERLIGVGGMAAVYAARHRVGAPVAIKILHPEIARRKDLRARFEQEARAMGRMAHPGAVEVRDIDETEDGAPFMVMELLEGESLKTLMQRQRELPLGELLRYADEALDVLAAAHREGIVHRDIKPDNLFITSAGPLKVVDFGVARMREGQPMTVVGTRLGTLPYMPPEQVAGGDIDGRVDVFAMGALMFRIIAKRRVHEVKTESDMIVAMSTRAAPPLMDVVPNVPEAVAHVVDCALAFSRERRYPDAATMQQDVRAVARGDAPTHALAMLAERGPPNPVMSVPPTRMPAALYSATSATKVETPVAAAQSAPLSATGAATPFDDAPISSTGVAPGVAALGGVALGGVALGMPKTAMIAAAQPAAHADATKVSAGVPMVGDATQVSAGVVPDRVTDPLPPVTQLLTVVAEPVADPVASERRRRAGAIVFAVGALAIVLVVLVAWFALGGDADDETSDKSRSGSETSDADEPSGGDDDTPLATAKVPGKKSVPLTPGLPVPKPAPPPLGQPPPAQPPPVKSPPGAAPPGTLPPFTVKTTTPPTLPQPPPAPTSKKKKKKEKKKKDEDD
jgi:serine/threonine-protein kinase